MNSTFSAPVILAKPYDGDDKKNIALHLCNNLAIVEYIGVFWDLHSYLLPLCL